MVDKKIKVFSIRKKITNIVITGFIFIFGSQLALTQNFVASPANWMYPDGNTYGTRNLEIPSSPQEIDSFKTKWSTNLIAGDVRPLIGNLVTNPSIRGGFSAPNEIAAVIGDEIVLIDGLGKLVSQQEFPVYVRGVKRISALMDTVGNNIANNINRPLVMGLESMEYAPEDSVVHAYVAGYNPTDEEIQVLNRLAVDLRNFAPNVYASIKPVFAKRANGELYVYGVVNTSQPTIPGDFDPGFGTAPYFRGFTQFNTGELLSSFPLPDVGDDISSRYTLGPEVNFEQPSIAALPNGVNGTLLPSYGSTSFPATQVPNPNGLISTFSDIVYLLGYDISDGFIFEDIAPIDLTPSMDSRPRVRPYYLDITDAETGDNMFILVAEEYSGIDGSTGTSKLHLFDINGNEITFTNIPDLLISPPQIGGENHFWSVATGDVDGNSDNEWLPYYPNNTGKELIVTQSTRDFSYPNNTLSVIRYYSGLEIEKPTPSNDFLFPFDTVFTERINGWVAAVNDLDGAIDGKDEIVLVDGSTLRIVRARDYESDEFRLGNCLDTVFTRTFTNQTISHVSIADLEGDGLNDLVVTTYDSTYVIGSIIPNTIELLSPDGSISEYCTGDTIRFEWYNIIEHSSDARIRFVPTEDGLPIPDSTFVIADSILNRSDTVRYDYVVNRQLIGYQGLFVIELIDRPDLVNANTPIYVFTGPDITLDPLGTDTYYIGSEMFISGNALCADSVRIEYLDQTGNYIPMDSTYVDFDGYFELRPEIPCLDIFNCGEEDLDSTLTMNIISDKAGFSDTVEVEVFVIPYPFPIEWETPQTADPTIIFNWDVNSLEYTCDEINILMSVDMGESFLQLDQQNVAEGSYTWLIPLDVPDSLMFRFCCGSSCVRTDTLIKDFKPNYIGIVAPNPFQPPLQTAEIVYRVPEETNVTIRIFDTANRLVKEIVNSEPRIPNIVYTATWDGRIESNGAMAHNGLYYIILELSSGVREIHPIYVRK